MYNQRIYIDLTHTYIRLNNLYDSQHKLRPQHEGVPQTAWQTGRPQYNSSVNLRWLTYINIHKNRVRRTQ